MEQNTEADTFSIDNDLMKALDEMEEAEEKKAAKQLQQQSSKTEENIQQSKPIIEEMEEDDSIEEPHTGIIPADSWGNDTKSSKREQKAGMEAQSRADNEDNVVPNEPPELTKREERIAQISTSSMKKSNRSIDKKPIKINIRALQTKKKKDANKRVLTNVVNRFKKIDETGKVVSEQGEMLERMRLDRGIIPYDQIEDDLKSIFISSAKAQSIVTFSFNGIPFNKWKFNPWRNTGEYAYNRWKFMLDYTEYLMKEINRIESYQMSNKKLSPQEAIDKLKESKNIPKFPNILKMPYVQTGGYIEINVQKVPKRVKLEDIKTPYILTTTDGVDSVNINPFFPYTPNLESTYSDTDILIDENINPEKLSNFYYRLKENMDKLYDEKGIPRKGTLDFPPNYDKLFYEPADIIAFKPSYLTHFEQLDISGGRKMDPYQYVGTLKIMLNEIIGRDSYLLINAVIPPSSNNKIQTNRHVPNDYRDKTCVKTFTLYMNAYGDCAMYATILQRSGYDIKRTVYNKKKDPITVAYLEKVNIYTSLTERYLLAHYYPAFSNLIGAEVETFKTFYEYQKKVKKLVQDYQGNLTDLAAQYLSAQAEKRKVRVLEMSQSKLIQVNNLTIDLENLNENQLKQVADLVQSMKKDQKKIEGKKDEKKEEDKHMSEDGETKQ